MLLWIGVFTLGAVALVAWDLLRWKPSAIAQRIAPSIPRLTAREMELEGNIVRRVVAPITRRFGRSLAGLLPVNLVRRVDRMLVMANEPMSLSAFLGLWLACALLGPMVLAYVALMRPDMTPLRLMVLAVGVLPFTTFLPYILLRRRVRARRKKIARALPDALDLLMTCVEAGLATDAAFAIVTEKTEGPISETFAVYLKQVGLGRARRDALAYMADRTGVPELTRIASKVKQAEEMGTTLGDAMRDMSEEMRLTRKFRAQEAAQKAPVLMTIPLVLCFLPAMGAVIVVPPIINLVNYIGRGFGAAS